MIYFISKAKFCIDFQNDEFWKCSKCPSDAIHIDLLSSEPMTTETRVERKTVHQQPASVLLLSGIDTVTMIAALTSLGWIKFPRLSLRFWQLWHNSPEEGLNTAIRAGLNLPAQGENSFFVNRQLNSDPDAWSKLRGIKK